MNGSRITRPVVRLFLVDDHDIVRSGIRQSLEQHEDLEVVGEAATAVSAVGGILTTWPDVAIVDVNLPDGNGIEVCREVKARRPEVRCLILTSYADDEALLQSVLAGASGYVLKHVRSGDLVSCIRRVAAGESLVDPRAAERLRERANRDVWDPLLGTLTSQERRILDLLAEGLTNREIGEQMFLAEKTVKNYVSHLLMKMGMHRRTEAAAYGARIAERRRQVLERHDAAVNPIQY